MSLINDALRRAKAAQDQKTPPTPLPEPRFRESVPAPSAARGPAWLLVAIIAGVVVLTAVLAFKVLGAKGSMTVAAAPATRAEEAHGESEKGNASAKSEVSAHPSIRGGTESAAPSIPVADPDIGPASSVVPAAAAQPASESGGQPNPVAAAPTSSPIVGSPSPETAKLAPVQVSEPPAPKLPEPKLQGLFYNPTRPSAMINGKTVFVGGKVGAWRVTTISQDSVTLTDGGQTNVLSLNQ